MDRLPRREAIGRRPPAVARPRHVADLAHRLVCLRVRFAATPRRRRKRGFDTVPFIIVRSLAWRFAFRSIMAIRPRACPVAWSG